MSREGTPAGGRSGRPFDRLLIANRGEIAVRIIRACRELGVESVAVYSDPDARSRHVRLADHAVRIGPAPATESYLRAERIVEAAVATGAQAIHPGYGFLSEQAAFASAIEAAGIVFVGPTPATLGSLGDKISARRSAHAEGVPIVPGTFAPLPADDASQIDTIARTAAEIGYPLLVKASAGGGGRGMRRVDRPEDLPVAVTTAANEARQAFGDGAVYLERYVEGGRHIEVQLLGEEGGRIIALGERDCSTQRRHQKLVEEAPAPGLTRDERARVHALAVQVARTVGLRNAATAEFLYSRDGDFYFLEVNARLQVEHGVTELVADLDLVPEQLWLAAGHALSARALAAAAAAADPVRHAFELRLSAEDPSRSFAPTPGLVTRWREPSGPGIRMDSFVEEGWRVSGDYDPLLAKLLVVDADRPAAIARALRALDELETGGVQTTAPFHRWLLANPAFVAGDLRTDMIDRTWEAGPIREAAARRAAALVAAAVAGGTAVPPGGAASAPAAPASAALPPGSRPVGADGSAPTGWPRPASPAWTHAGRREATERWP
ncbi:MAG: acetyl/propionyl/methylcrotonyl-CoA carboxylase subunit alpha [Chloroflexota bacterium]